MRRKSPRRRKIADPKNRNFDEFVYFDFVAVNGSRRRRFEFGFAVIVGKFPFQSRRFERFRPIFVRFGRFVARFVSTQFRIAFGQDAFFQRRRLAESASGAAASSSSSEAAAAASRKSGDVFFQSEPPRRRSAPGLHRGRGQKRQVPLLSILWLQIPLQRERYQTRETDAQEGVRGGFDRVRRNPRVAGFPNFESEEAATTTSSTTTTTAAPSSAVIERHVGQ